jgi:RND family efflux transporter MFP subunit
MTAIMRGDYTPPQARRTAAERRRPSAIIGEAMIPLRFFLVLGGLLAAMRAAGASEFDCMIEARQTVEIRSSVEAVIESVKVTRGAFVSKGQVIVTLQSGPERAALALADGRAKSLGDIKVSEARVEITRKKFTRAEELFKQSFISANARDEAEADFKLASEELSRAKDGQRLAELEAQRTAEVLALRTIRSPVNGVVVEVMRRAGEFGAITFKDPIMKLAEIDPLHVEAILPASMFGKVKRGQRAIVVPEASIGGRYETTVAIVDPVIDAASGTLGVRMLLPNRRFAIPAGVRCRVSFP